MSTTTKKPAKKSRYKRRKYAEGRCQDCGYIKFVTRIKFWATGMLYDVCGTCIRPYRGVICTPPLRTEPTA